MNDKILAHKILQFRNSTSLMIPSRLAAEIGAAGLQDALARSWVRPDTDTGYLVLTDQTSLIQEMAALADAKCKNCEQDDCPGCDKKHEVTTKEESAAHNPAVHHATRRVTEMFGTGGNSTGGGAPGSGQPPRAAGSPVPVTTPTAPTSSAAAGTTDYVIGDPVVIAEEGRVYHAKVGSRNQDGTYTLSFGPERPATTRAYKREEIQRTNAKPGETPTPAL